MMKKFVIVLILACLTTLFKCINGIDKHYWPQTPEKVLLGTLKGTSGSEGGEPCDDNRLIHCQHSFNSFLGITTDSDWHNSLQFQLDLLNIYQQNGTQGFLKVCQAYTLFYQCLGPTYAACNDPLFYLRHGYDIMNAVFYPGVIAQLHFQCGGGLQTALANWHCLQQVTTNYTERFLQCNANYSISSMSDPSKTCAYAKKDMECVRKPYRDNCNPPTSWYMCEYTRVFLNVHLPTCNLRCFVGGRYSRSSNKKGIQIDLPPMIKADPGVPETKNASDSQTEGKNQ